MRRQRATQTIQKAPLFTFLDVLTCTMGLLILLLVAIARQTKLKSIDAVETARATVTATQAEWDALQQRLAAARASRDQQLNQLNGLQGTLQTARSETQKLRDELAELERARALLEQSLATSPDADPSELSKLQSRISELQEKLRTARSKGATTSFAVVPYVGPNETRRRPIYIECCHDRIVLQPEGVTLTARDFEGPLDNSNALASAVRAAEQHLGRNSQSSLRESGEAYPLLLVRPDGVNSYYVARAALRAWGSDFGYELIDGQWNLDFKEPDAKLATVEAKAVEEARERQQYLGYAGSGSGGGGGGSFHSRARGVGGGFSPPDEEESNSGRFRVSADGRVVRESGSATRLRSRAGGGRLGRYAEITGDGSSSQATGGSNATSGKGRGSRPSVAEWQDPPVVASWPDMGSELGSGSGRSTSTATADKPNASSVASSASSDSGTNQGSSASHTPQGQLGQSGQLSQGQPGQPGQGQPSQGQPGQPGQPSLGNPNGSAMGSPADPTVASDQQGPQILPQKLFGQSQQREGGASSLAESQGKNWALPDSSRGSIPVTRPIHVQCLEDRIVVLPEAPGGPGRRDLPFAGPTTNAVTGLITAIWDRMDGWGIAGKGMYWRPELHVQASPEAARRLAELKILLADSGIVIVDKPAIRTARRF